MNYLISSIIEVFAMNRLVPWTFERINVIAIRINTYEVESISAVEQGIPLSRGTFLGLKAPLPPPWKPCKTAEGEQPLPLLRALGAGEGVTQLAIVGEFKTGASLEMRRHDCVQRGRFHLFFISRFSPCGEFSSPLHEFNQTISIIAERRIFADYQ